MLRTAVLLAGCLAAALAAGLAGGATLMLMVSLREGSTAGGWLSGMMVFGAILAVYGLAASLTLGLLGHALLVRLGRTGWAGYLVAGAIAGGLTGLLFGGASDHPILITGLAAGVGGALAFRAVVGRRARVQAAATA